jgi:hypothetical protein
MSQVKKKLPAVNVLVDIDSRLFRTIEEMNVEEKKKTGFFFSLSYGHGFFIINGNLRSFFPLHSLGRSFVEYSSHYTTQKLKE